MTGESEFERQPTQVAGPFLREFQYEPGVLKCSPGWREQPAQNNWERRRDRK